MGETATGIEGEINGLIQDFDTNLSDPRLRKEAERSLKSALPEYKAKMLVLGKAKLLAGE